MQLSSVNILDLLKDGKHFSEKRGDKIHIIDSLTGKSVVIYSDPRTSHIPTQFQQLEDGTYVQLGVNILPERREVVYNPVTVDLLCQLIAGGMGLTRACEHPGMPTYTTVCRWRRHHSWIDEALEQARRDRAEWHRDQALAEAEAASGRDPISGAQLRVDTHKWAAGVDHSRYSPKAKVEATITAPTQIIVHTGIPREVAAPTRDVGDKSE